MMLDRLLTLLRGEQENAPGPDRVPTALAVLLLELAHADGHCDPEETQRLLELLRQRFEISAEAAADLVELAEAQRRQSVDLYAFTREINWAFTTEEKIKIAELLWEVGFADGRLDAHEEALMRQIGPLIGLSLRQVMDAKLRARDRTAERSDR